MNLPVPGLGVPRCSVLAALRRRLRPDLTVVEVGAGRGRLTTALAAMVGPQGAVHAFEPVPERYRALVRRFPSPCCPSVHLHEVALVHRVDVAGPRLPLDPLAVPLAAWGRHLQRQTKDALREVSLIRRLKRRLFPPRRREQRSDAVDGLAPPSALAGTQPGQGRPADAVQTLDEFARQWPALHCLCVDTGGAEALVLLGALALLQRHRPLVVVRLCEAWLRRTGFCAHYVLQLLKGAGYTPLRPEGDEYANSDDLEERIEAEPRWPFDVLLVPLVQNHPATIVGPDWAGIAVVDAVTAPPATPLRPACADRVPRTVDPDGRCLRILLTYNGNNTYTLHDDQSAAFAAFAAAGRGLGYQVDLFSIAPPPLARRLTWPELDQRWRERDPALLRLYDDLAAKLATTDVLLNACNLHPAWLSQAPVFAVGLFGDDPEASEVLTRHVSGAFDLVAVYNPACLDMYRAWGLRDVVLLPIGAWPGSFDPGLTEDHLMRRPRRTPVVLLVTRDPHRDLAVEELRRAFPEALIRGRGWPGGPYPADQQIALYQDTRVGWSFDQSIGPVTRRTFEVPANGAMLLTQNRAFVHHWFEPGVEAVGFDTIAECIDLTRYYLDHEDERLTIARAGWRRTVQEYTAANLWRRLMRAVAVRLRLAAASQP